MKYNPHVTSSRRKCRKAHFTAPPRMRRVLMSAPLSTHLHIKYNVRSVPVRKGDEVQVIHGTYKGREGNVVQDMKDFLRGKLRKGVIGKLKGSLLLMMLLLVLLFKILIRSWLFLICCF
nr:60S ribosomal protein L26-1-like [Tanacetum cinerariifolium]